LLPIDGIDFVGPLPPEVQRVTIFSAGVGTASTNPVVAKIFIDFLASSAAIRIIRKTSLEALVVELFGRALCPYSVVSPASLSPWHLLL
jgi:hypothetical protein